jgi:hypothetical protein
MFFLACNAKQMLPLLVLMVGAGGVIRQRTFNAKVSGSGH